MKGSTILSISGRLKSGMDGERMSDDGIGLRPGDSARVRWPKNSPPLAELCLVIKNHPCFFSYFSVNFNRER